jgi:hypothetical protein
MPSNKQMTANNSLAAHPGGGPSRQGGAQQGTGARGEQYLYGSALRHTILAARIVWLPQPKHLQAKPLNHNKKHPN